MRCFSGTIVDKAVYRFLLAIPMSQQQNQIQCDIFSSNEHRLKCRHRVTLHLNESWNFKKQLHVIYKQNEKKVTVL
jgi:hypothetical protein